MMKEAQGQMTVVILIKLLDQGLRLPCPKDCPHEVMFDAYQSNLVLFGIMKVSFFHGYLFMNR